MAFTQELKTFENEEQWFNYLDRLNKGIHATGMNWEIHSVETSIGGYATVGNHLLNLKHPEFPFDATILTCETSGYNPDGPDNRDYIWIQF